MKPVRILIIEDDSDLMEVIEEQYRALFSLRGSEVSIEKATTVNEARSMAKQARSAPYDFVSLDVNLGDTHLTGLDVLDTFKRFQSAWMVALLTGVETDTTLDDTMGESRADDLRRQLRRDAYTRFPPDRLLVVEKPSPTLVPAEAHTLLVNRLEQIVSVYEEMGRQRYIFRPIEVTSLERVPRPKGSKGLRKFIETTSLHWQIRFNCGEIRTLPNLSGFRTLHYLLSRDRQTSVTPEEALAIEPKHEKPEPKQSSDEDPVAAYFEAQGIGWRELNTSEQEKLIRAALSLKFNRYVDLRTLQDEDDLTPAEEKELQRITSELGPLSDAAETGYLRMTPPADDESATPQENSSVLVREGLHLEGGNYEKMGKGRRGYDSPAASLFRARMKRVKDCLRENGFADLAQHVEDYITSTGANWSYNPPRGIQWTT